MQQGLRVFILLLLVIPVVHSSLAQQQKNTRTADKYYDRKDYANAVRHYRDGLDFSEQDARLWFRAGFAAIQVMDYDFAVKCLSRAFSLNPTVDPYIEYHLGLACSQTHEYLRAVNHLRSYREKSRSLAGFVDRKIEECLLADSIINLPSRSAVEPLDALNTRFDEIAPLITRDERMFVFTSNRTDESRHSRNRTTLEDVYVTSYKQNRWAEPERISKRINVRPREAAVWLSASGTTMLLYYEDGQGDIYQSDFVNGKWTAPKALNNFINKPDSRESGACISPDGQRLYFVSNRRGGKGGFDIYVSERTSNDDWGRPSNLGSTVNTPGDEEYPFMHTDGTLFFSSNGHITLGGTDIFRTRQKEGKWSSPENLGYPINSAGFDGYFVLTPDGKKGYFASRRTGNDVDLYMAVSIDSSFGLADSDATADSGDDTAAADLRE